MPDQLPGSLTLSLTAGISAGKRTLFDALGILVLAADLWNTANEKVADYT